MQTHPFQDSCLIHDDPDLLDMFRRPLWPENPVSETQTEQVEHGRPAKEMVNPEDLFLRDEFQNGLIERVGTLLAGTERFLLDEHCAMAGICRIP